MGIIDRLKSMVGLEKEEAFRRWSATELADKKAYLESSPRAHSLLRTITCLLSGSFSDTFQKGMSLQMSSGRKKSKR